MTRFITLAAVSLVLSSASPVSADVIVDQPSNVANSAIASQTFPDFLTANCLAFDDFTLSSKYALTSLRVYGFELGGDPSQNVSVTAQFRAAANVSSPGLMSFTGSESGSDLVFDLGGALLGPGTYWISAFVTRPVSTGGQWFWYFHRPVTGSQAMWQNPWGAFGMGTNPITAGAVAEADSVDLAFRLEGHTSTSTVPAPPALVLVGLGAGCVAVRRSLRRRATA
jgi:hypothetical protein